MATKKINVLVYTGSGTSGESVRHCIFSLRHILTPNYAVIPVSEAVILKEPWVSTCALLVFPGGGDLGYCRAFNGAGNRKITDFVRRGGSYLGFCAGGYYGSRRCEFEVGNKPLEVIGNRELAFFPGICRGAALKGFDYNSEKGARAVKLNISADAFTEDVPEDTVSYFNGGGVFVDAKAAGDGKVEVLATYGDDIDVDGGDGKAAVVLCDVGKGRALLTGPHPEFAGRNLNPRPDVPGYDSLIARLTANDLGRLKFIKACLSKLGLTIDHEVSTIPELSRSLFLSSSRKTHVSKLLKSWSDILEEDSGQSYIKGEADTFLVYENELKGQSIIATEGVSSDTTPLAMRLHIYKAGHEEAGFPTSKEVPQFDHNLFFSRLEFFRQMEAVPVLSWGNLLMYGEVVTSTNTLLEKLVIHHPGIIRKRLTSWDRNHDLTAHLPTGFTFAASTQVAGRGRGTNVWIAPPGSLLFSTIIKHPAQWAASRPIVFIQYIAAIAVVEAIQNYAKGYEDVPIKLKWPNDIYARDPESSESSPSYVKIGGILSQCVYSDGAYQIILGIGINVTNPRPTTSLSDIIPEGVEQPRIEAVLAGVLARMEVIHAQFIAEGFSKDLERRYYRHWLHTGQAVSLEAEGGVKARVIGITRDWGMLRVEETDSEGRGTGRMWALQSDENSFDYWKGLVRRKL